MTKGRRRILKIKRWLADNFPGKYPVRVIVSRMPKGLEDCLGAYVPPYDSKYSTVWICKRSSQSQKIETLLHEWAHCRTDPDAEKSECLHGGHTNAFYLEYGRIERAYMAALSRDLRVKE
ncbi:MAG: hypothetical protein CME21_21455 [Gemmatimonadetes bacterium]|nr:hypothetical protein [Gemmatimonadota bacterium]|tara:strand:- start:299 stop:658 length:360 start_codon:yes stop_codon:yes gene_type:complete